MQSKSTRSSSAKFLPSIWQSWCKVYSTVTGSRTLEDGFQKLIITVNFILRTRPVMLIKSVRQLYLQSAAQHYKSETKSGILRRLGSQCLRQPNDDGQVYWISNSGK